MRMLRLQWQQTATASDPGKGKSAPLLHQGVRLDANDYLFAKYIILF